MGCNGYGHAPDCNCGWGGVFYGASGKLSWGDNRSYIIPNAKCPECGKEVFFYRNEHGSKVYFDSLGPPWPVHPCFGAYNKENKEALGTLRLREWTPVKVHWLQQAGWGVTLMGISPDRHLFLKVKKNFTRLNVNAPWYCRIKSIEFDEFECSTLVANVKGEIIVRNLDGFGLRIFKKSGAIKKYPELYLAHFNESGERRHPD